MISKLVIALVLVLLLAVSASATEPTIEVTPIIQPSPSAEITPTDIQIRHELGVDLLVKTFDVPPYIDPEQFVRQELERGGVEYILREIFVQSQTSSASARQAVQMLTISADSDSRAEILALLPDRVEYNSGGYEGWLYLDDFTTEVESTRAYTRTVSEVREFHGLARNDPYLIPKSIQVGGVTFALTDIQWRAGSPNERNPMFSAFATYTGRVGGQTPDGFPVTARFAGNVSRETPGNIVYTVIYEPVPPEVIVYDEPGGFALGGAVRGALIVVVGAGLGVAVFLLRKRLPFKLRRKAKRDKHRAPEHEAVARPARRKPHALGYMKRDGEPGNV